MMADVNGDGKLELIYKALGDIDGDGRADVVVEGVGLNRAAV